eukprot:CAMPEP_0178991052 /NCGR_PEP_ID=MMETSP0795-20121207/5307_1 /TAXON_ID=88552 /ORGANISM="Amoebophrya sp., Strain Ameob2" /LENGTH=2203 /DNA_ID=CAMNT_0020682705 /DNA_START=927 /DNA_END=7538 /DNA_ORIENTATION=+
MRDLFALLLVAAGVLGLSKNERGYDKVEFEEVNQVHHDAKPEPAQATTSDEVAKQILQTDVTIEGSGQQSFGDQNAPLQGTQISSTAAAASTQESDTAASSGPGGELVLSDDSAAQQEMIAQRGQEKQDVHSATAGAAATPDHAEGEGATDKGGRSGSRSARSSGSGTSGSRTRTPAPAPPKNAEESREHDHDRPFEETKHVDHLVRGAPPEAHSTDPDAAPGEDDTDDDLIQSNYFAHLCVQHCALGKADKKSRRKLIQAMKESWPRDQARGLLACVRQWARPELVLTLLKKGCAFRWIDNVKVENAGDNDHAIPLAGLSEEHYRKNMTSSASMLRGKRGDLIPGVDEEAGLLHPTVTYDTHDVFREVLERFLTTSGGGRNADMEEFGDLPIEQQPDDVEKAATTYPPLYNTKDPSSSRTSTSISSMQAGATPATQGGATESIPFPTTSSTHTALAPHESGHQITFKTSPRARAERLHKYLQAFVVHIRMHCGHRCERANAIWDMDEYRTDVRRLVETLAPFSPLLGQTDPKAAAVVSLLHAAEWDEFGTTFLQQSLFQCTIFWLYAAVMFLLHRRRLYNHAKENFRHLSALGFPEVSAFSLAADEKEMQEQEEGGRWARVHWLLQKWLKARGAAPAALTDGATGVAGAPPNSIEMNKSILDDSTLQLGDGAIEKLVDVTPEVVHTVERETTTTIVSSSLSWSIGGPKRSNEQGDTQLLATPQGAGGAGPRTRRGLPAEIFREGEHKSSSSSSTANSSPVLNVLNETTTTPSPPTALNETTTSSTPGPPTIQEEQGAPPPPAPPPARALLTTASTDADPVPAGGAHLQLQAEGGALESLDSGPPSMRDEAASAHAQNAASGSRSPDDFLPPRVVESTDVDHGDSADADAPSASNKKEDDADAGSASSNNAAAAVERSPEEDHPPTSNELPQRAPDLEKDDVIAIESSRHTTRYLVDAKNSIRMLSSQTTADHGGADHHGDSSGKLREPILSNPYRTIIQQDLKLSKEANAANVGTRAASSSSSASTRTADALAGAGNSDMESTAASSTGAGGASSSSKQSASDETPRNDSTSTSSQAAFATQQQARREAARTRTPTVKNLLEPDLDDSHIYLPDADPIVRVHEVTYETLEGTCHVISPEAIPLFSPGTGESPGEDESGGVNSSMDTSEYERSYLQTPNLIAPPPSSSKPGGGADEDVVGESDFLLGLGGRGNFRGRRDHGNGFQFSMFSRPKDDEDDKNGNGFDVEGRREVKPHKRKAVAGGSSPSGGATTRLVVSKFTGAAAPVETQQLAPSSHSRAGAVGRRVTFADDQKDEDDHNQCMNYDVATCRCIEAELDDEESLAVVPIHQQIAFVLLNAPDEETLLGTGLCGGGSSASRRGTGVSGPGTQLKDFFAGASVVAGRGIKMVTSEPPTSSSSSSSSGGNSISGSFVRGDDKNWRSYVDSRDASSSPTSSSPASEILENSHQQPALRHPASTEPYEAHDEYYTALTGAFRSTVANANNEHYDYGSRSRKRKAKKVDVPVVQGHVVVSAGVDAAAGPSSLTTGWRSSKRIQKRRDSSADDPLLHAPGLMASVYRCAHRTLASQASKRRFFVLRQFVCGFCNMHVSLVSHFTNDVLGGGLEDVSASCRDDVDVEDGENEGGHTSKLSAEAEVESFCRSEAMRNMIRDIEKLLRMVLTAVAFAWLHASGRFCEFAFLGCSSLLLAAASGTFAGGLCDVLLPSGEERETEGQEALHSRAKELLVLDWGALFGLEGEPVAGETASEKLLMLQDEHPSESRRNSRLRMQRLRRNRMRMLTQQQPDPEDQHSKNEQEEQEDLHSDDSSHAQASGTGPTGPATAEVCLGPSSRVYERAAFVSLLSAGAAALLPTLARLFGLLPPFLYTETDKELQTTLLGKSDSYTRFCAVCLDTVAFLVQTDRVYQLYMIVYGCGFVLEKKNVNVALHILRWEKLRLRRVLNLFLGAHFCILSVVILFCAHELWLRSYCIGPAGAFNGWPSSAAFSTSTSSATSTFRAAGFSSRPSSFLEEGAGGGGGAARGAGGSTPRPPGSHSSKMAARIVDDARAVNQIETATPTTANPMNKEDSRSYWALGQYQLPYGASVLSFGEGKWKIFAAVIAYAVTAFSAPLYVTVKHLDSHGRMLECVLDSGFAILLVACVLSVLGICELGTQLAERTTNFTGMDGGGRPTGADRAPGAAVGGGD